MDETPSPTVFAPRRPGPPLRVALLWGVAGVASVLAHGGLAAWMLSEPPIPIADNAPPPSIMIDLAPEPEAVVTEQTTISEQTEESVEVKPETAEPVEETPPPEPVVEEAMEEPPPPEEPEPEPVEEPLPPLPEVVAVPLPAPRPQPKPEKPRPREIARPRPAEKPAPKPAPAPPSKAANAAAAQVRASDRNAASQSVAGSGFGSVSPARWQSRLMAHLERRKRYPAGARSRGEEGTVQVRFSIDDNGNVLSVSLAGSSGYPELDGAVLELVRRASPVPAPPPGVSKTVLAPVRFNTR